MRWIRRPLNSSNVASTQSGPEFLFQVVPSIHYLLFATPPINLSHIFLPILSNFLKLGPKVSRSRRLITNHFLAQLFIIGKTVIGSMYRQRFPPEVAIEDQILTQYARKSHSYELNIHQPLSFEEKHRKAQTVGFNKVVLQVSRNRS